MKCRFCATGTLGFKRNLTYEEIADQVLYFAAKLQKEGESVSHVVYMGMGRTFFKLRTSYKIDRFTSQLRRH